MRFFNLSRATNFPRELQILGQFLGHLSSAHSAKPTALVGGTVYVLSSYQCAFTINTSSNAEISNGDTSVNIVIGSIELAKHVG